MPMPNAHANVGRVSWLGRLRLENPLGHGNFLSGLKLGGERDGGLELARFSAVCPLGGHMLANNRMRPRANPTPCGPMRHAPCGPMRDAGSSTK
jgi:hypothetical protein